VDFIERSSGFIVAAGAALVIFIIVYMACSFSYSCGYNKGKVEIKTERIQNEYSK
jgi:hypothetical protein